MKAADYEDTIAEIQAEYERGEYQDDPEMAGRRASREQQEELDRRQLPKRQSRPSILHNAREALNRVNDLARWVQYESESLTSADMMAMARETCDYYVAAHYYMTAYHYRALVESESSPLPPKWAGDTARQADEYAAKAATILRKYGDHGGNMSLGDLDIHPAMALLLISGFATVAAGIIVRRAKVILPGVALVVLAIVLAYAWGTL